MFFSNPFPDAFGLDIGDLSIKLVQLAAPSRLTPHAGITIKEIRTLNLAPGLIVNGEIQQPELVRKKILHLLEGGEGRRRITSPWVVADLPDPKTFLKLIEIDTPASELISDEIVFQAKKHLPFDLEETYLDWQIIDQGGPASSKSLVLLGAVPKVVADSYTYLLEAADLKPLALEIEALAISRTLITRRKDYTGVGRALLDLGATRSSLIIYDNESVQLSTSLNFSGEIMTTALAQGLGISHDDAEKLKITIGFRQDPSHPKYLSIVAGIIDSLVIEIKKALSFYSEHFPSANAITHITMCGGVAAGLGLDEILTHKLKIASRPVNIWKNLDGVVPPHMNISESLGLASALGLALRAVENPLKA